MNNLSRPAWILFAGTFINRFGTFVMPMLALYLTRSGFTIAQSGIAISAYGAGHFATSLLGGHLADRIGRRNTIALSMFASGATMLALSQARGFASIVALVFAAGLSTELYRPASSALLSDVVAPDQRVLAFGFYRFAINLGFAVGPATAGFLAERSFLYVFLGDAISSFAFGIIALVALPHGIHQSEDRETFREAFTDRRLVVFLLASVCITWVYFQMSSTLPIHLARNGYTPSQYGMLMSINGLFVVLFEIALTLWLQRFKHVPVIAIGYALLGIGWALTGFAHTLLALAITVAIWTIAEMIFAPMASAYVTELAPERARGRYHGLHMLTYSIGMLAGPTLGALLYERSEGWLWIGCAVSGVVGAALMSLSKRTPRASRSPAPHHSDARAATTDSSQARSATPESPTRPSPRLRCE